MSRLASRTAWLVLALLLWVTTPASGQLTDCGGEGERPCGVLDPEFVQNGTGECDNGLASRTFVCGCIQRGIRGNCLIPKLCTECRNTTRRLPEGTAFEASWENWALRNQRTLAIDEPINRVMHLGAHNAYNTQVDDPGNLAPNQYYSLTDQLRLGARVLELDIHLINGFVRVGHCKDKLFDLRVEAPPGCGPFERLWGNATKEISNWMRANPNEILLIQIEDHADTATDDVNLPLSRYLDTSLGRIFATDDLQNLRDAKGDRWPTRRELLAAGKRVIITGTKPHGGNFIHTVGQSTWSRHGGGFLQGKYTLDYKFNSAPRLESGDPDPRKELNWDFRPRDGVCWSGKDFSAAEANLHESDYCKPDDGYALCYSEDADRVGGLNETRNIYFLHNPLGLIQEADVAAAVRCNVVSVKLDFFSEKERAPAGGLNDRRQRFAVWSWKYGDRGTGGDCAMFNGNASNANPEQPDNQWESRSCGEVHRFACGRPRSESGLDPLDWTDPLGEDWCVTASAGRWEDGLSACRSECPGYVFGVPVNGYQNEQLNVANSGGDDLWLHYTDREREGSWVIPRIDENNSPPIADAGPDQLLQVPGDVAAEVALDGSGSSDPDGDLLTYTWTGDFPEGAGTASGVMATVTLPAGSHTITLTVDDGKGELDIDIVVITVNQIPEASAGPDQLLHISAGETANVTLDGSESFDPDGDPLVHTWTGPFPDGGGTAMGEVVTVTLPPGIHTVTLSVEDGNGGIGSDTVDITVNQLPVANAGPDQDLNAPGPAGLAVTLDGSGSIDADSDPLSYTWSGPFGTASGVSPTVQIPGGVHTVKLTVDDGRGGVDTNTVTITVRTIEISPSLLTFTVARGSGATSKPFTVGALGGTVGYSIARTAHWLDSSPTSGESSGEADTINAVVDPGSLTPGAYMANLVVNGPGVIKQSLRVTLIVTGGSSGSPPTPKPFANGVVDTADFTPFGDPGHATAVLSMVSIFGEDFVAEGEFRSESVPLPTILGGVMVTFDGIKAGLFLVSPRLIIAQMPAGVTPPTATMVIVNGGAKAASAPLEIQVAAHSPGIFTVTQDGEGQGTVVHAGTVDLAAPVGAIGESRPAGEGDHLTIYMNGLGPVDPPLADGHNSCEPDGVCLPDGSNVVLHHTVAAPVIRIGGVEVPEENVLFSGASPASVGVNEVVFTMPAGVPTSDAVSLTVEMGGVVSRAVTIAVE